MIKEQTIAEQLKIKEFPFTIKDKNGNIIYREKHDKSWYKNEYNDYGNKISGENSDGYFYKIEYNDSENIIYYENNEVLWDRRPKVAPSTTKK